MCKNSSPSSNSSRSLPLENSIYLFSQGRPGSTPGSAAEPGSDVPLSRFFQNRVVQGLVSYYPPYEKTIDLPVPENGRRFNSARVLNSTQSIELVQNENGVRLLFGEGHIWLPLDTIIELN